MSLLAYLHRVCEGRDLPSTDAFQAMHSILAGEASPVQIAAFVVALRMKGETAAELAGFARAMRERAARVDARVSGEPLLDTCGTGGDGASTFNISTVAAFVVAGAGVRVAKHGNRSLSSRCGSADVLEELGVAIQQTPEQSARAIREIGVGFLFAPAIHSAMKHAQPVRAELKLRTAFNLLGPLTNPAGANVQLVGAPSDRAAELMAGALAELGIDRALVAHGGDGLDEITTTGPTLAFEVTPGRVERRTLRPEDFGVELASSADLKGGDRVRNAEIARAILAGEPGAARDVVLVNASAALVVAGKAVDFLDGAKLAAASIDSGAARAKLDALAQFTAASH
jgi:anthranilate phosphoribosyltransferase